MWEALSGNEFYTLAGHKVAVTDVAFRPDSNVLLSSSEDGTAKLWDMNTGKEIQSVAAHGSGVLSVDFAPDGHFVTSGRDRVVRVWKPDGSKLKDLPPMNDTALHAVFGGPDGSTVISDDWRGQVRVTNVSTTQPVASLEANPPTVAERIASARAVMSETQAAKSKADASKAAAAETARKASAEAQAAQTAADAATSAIVAAQANATAVATAAANAVAALQAAEKDATARNAEHARLAQVVAAAEAAVQTNAQSNPASTQPSTQSTGSWAGADPSPADQVRVLSAAATRAKAEHGAAGSALVAAQQDVQTKRTASERAASDTAAATAALEKSKTDAAAASAVVAPLAAKASTATATLTAATQAADTAATKLMGARATLRQWQRAAAFAELSTARAELQRQGEQQQRIDQALKQLESAERIKREGPQRVAELTQRVAAAELASATASKNAEAIKSAVSDRHPATTQATVSLNQIESLKTKNADNKTISEAAQKAKESLELLESELTALRASAASADEAAGKAMAELKAAQAALAATQAELAAAPGRADEARAGLGSVLTADQNSRKERVDRLATEYERLAPGPGE